jgi:TatD DNase family protein
VLTDSHCHLEPKDFADRDDAIARAREAGVERLVCVGSGAGFDEIRNAVALAEGDARIWAAVGLHPHDAARAPAGVLDEIERLATTHARVVAVGETGLDYHYNHSPADEQRSVLRAHLAIARKAKKPVSFHIRDAHDEAARIMEEEKIGETGGVIHCFTGGLEDAKRYVALGLHLSFSGILTFKSAGNIREAAAWAPLDRILIETDCPYLAPQPMRGKRNEPAYLVHTARFLAELRGISVEALAQATSDNAARLFRLQS